MAGRTEQRKISWETGGLHSGPDLTAAGWMPLDVSFSWSPLPFGQNKTSGVIKFPPTLKSHIPVMKSLVLWMSLYKTWPVCLCLHPLQPFLTWVTHMFSALSPYSDCKTCGQWEVSPLKYYSHVPSYIDLTAHLCETFPVFSVYTLQFTPLELSPLSS